MSVVPAMLAERLGLPQVTFASEVDRRRRHGDDPRATRRGSETVEASLPALVSVTDQINEPRYPSFKGIMAAKKKPVETWSLADLGVDADEVGLAAAWTAVVESSRSARRASRGQIVTDEGDGGAKLAEFLAAPEVHLSRPTPKGERDAWLRSSSWSTTSTATVQEAPPSC